MLNGFLHPMAAYSAFQETWMFGRLGCEIYAACCGLFGLVSIVTLTAIAIERCMVISVKPWYGGNLFSNNKAKIAIVFIWTYCLFIMLPPLLGWGALVPEGFLTSCSFDYLSRTASNRSYFIFIFFLGFFFPIIIISICYSFIMKTIIQNEKEIKRNNVKKIYCKTKKRNDYKAAEMIMFVIAMFLLSWTPYSLVACIGQFGNRSILTPWVSVLPSLFAKMSTIYNPAIYGLSHRHFRATLRRIFKSTTPSSDKGATYYSRNSPLSRTRNACSCLRPNGPSDIFEDNSSLVEHKVFLGLQIFDQEANKIVYVRKTHNEITDLATHACLESSSKFKFPANFSRPVKSNLRPSSSGRLAILTLPVDATHCSLGKYPMFRSEHSLHQKYQTLVEQDAMIKVPTVTFFKNKNEETDCISIQNIHVKVLERKSAEDVRK